LGSVCRGRRRYAGSRAPVLGYCAGRPRRGAADRVGHARGVRSPARRRAGVGAPSASSFYQIPCRGRRSRRFRFPFLRCADGGLDGPADPRGDRRPAGVGRTAMAAFHRPVGHRRLAAPLGPPAAGDRRCRRPRLFALVLSLSSGCPVQLFCSVAGGTARLWPGRSIRCCDDLGAHNNCIQNRHVLGDPPPDRSRHPGGDRRRARSGSASGGGILALVLHRAIARHILRLRDRVRARQGRLGRARRDGDPGYRRRPGSGRAGEPQFDRAGLRLRRDGHQTDPCVVRGFTVR